MKPSDYPKSTEADICLILEGTYPFLKGGVANWVDELIRSFPVYRFAVIFLGTKEEDYEDLKYQFPDNLVHFQANYLFQNQTIYPHSNPKIDHVTQDRIECMHSKFNTFLDSDSEMIPEIYDLLESDDRINEQLFLRSKNSWDLLTKKYYEKYPNESFFDYFWTVRGLHRPFWGLHTIVNTLPKIKILHSASTGYAGFLGALIQKKYDIPYILTEHGIYTKERWIELMRNYFFEHIIQDKNPFHPNKGLISIWMHFFSILAKIGYSRSRVIISLIEEYRQRQIKDGALPDKTRIIPYGIDFNRYAFIEDKKPNQKKPIIACVGRVVPIKDIKTFIRACALIIKKNPHIEAWIVGTLEEDKDYVESCVNLINIFNLQDKIKLLGPKNVIEIYSQIDLLVLCSISEGSPFVILESFAVGVPVVATNVGGCSELIYGNTTEDRALGEAGRLVNIADPEAIAVAVTDLLNDENEWFSVQRTALKRVRTYYSITQFIENYKLIYEDALVNGGNRI